MITNRYEKGDKYLDLEKYTAVGMDEDGFRVEDECWECRIYSKKDTPSSGDFIEFGNELMARMFIEQNEWKEQVL
jgi:hypothetical protein